MPELNKCSLIDEQAKVSHSLVGCVVLIEGI